MSNPPAPELLAILDEQRGRTASEAFEWTTDTLVHQGAVVGFYQREIKDRIGNLHQRDVIQHPGAVSVVAFDGASIYLVEQYRASIDANLIELPAGKRDIVGEPAELTAHRELEEEVGLKADSMELLLNIHHSPGFCDEYGYIFLATGLTKTQLKRQGPEEQEMQIKKTLLADAVKMCFDGRITDSKSIAGILGTAHRLAPR